MIVSSVKAVGRTLGTVVDAEDRKVLGQGVILLLAAAIVVVSIAGGAGLAYQLFRLTSGI